jgi:hypothetical protein
MPPLRQYLSRLQKRQVSPLLPPKATDPGPCGFSPCKPVVFRGPPEGAMIAIVDPRQADLVMVGEGHAPVGAVLVPCLELAAMCVPKGRGPWHPGLFLLNSAPSEVPKGVPWVPIMDPPAATANV